MSSSLFAVATPPPISNAFDDFQGATDGMIATNANATSNLLDHWFFSDAIPSWISWLITLGAGAAVVAVMIGGGMVVLSGVNQDLKEKGITTIIWALAGIVISMLSYTFVEIINMLSISQEHATNTDLIDENNSLIQNLIQGDLQKDLIPEFIKILLRLTGLATLVLIIYAGVLMVIRNDDDEATTKANKILYMSLIGLIIIAVAYAAVDAVASLTFSRSL